MISRQLEATFPCRPKGKMAGTDDGKTVSEVKVAQSRGEASANIAIEVRIAADVWIRRFSRVIPLVIIFCARTCGD